MSYFIKKNMKKIFLFFLLFGTSMISNAQANKKDVKILLEVSGVTTKYQLIVDQFSEQLPKESQLNFKKDVQVYIDKLINKEIDQYASAFSQDEILKLIEFYKSPLGIKLVEESNKINILIEEEFDNSQTELQGVIMKYFM